MWRLPTARMGPDSILDYLNSFLIAVHDIKLSRLCSTALDGFCSDDTHEQMLAGIIKPDKAHRLESHLRGHAMYYRLHSTDSAESADSESAEN